MSLKKGQRVRHPIQVEWGLGEVLADPGEDKVRVFFVGAGEKILSLKYVTLQSVPKEEAAHPVLDNLRVPREGGHEYQSLQESVERFLGQYPLGFRGHRFVCHTWMGPIDAFADFLVGVLPIQKVVPGSLRGNQLFSGNSRSVRPLVANSAMDSKRRRAFLGL